MKEKFVSNGWLLVDKPEGVESFGVIRKLKFRFQMNLKEIIRMLMNQKEPHTQSSNDNNSS